MSKKMFLNSGGRSSAIFFAFFLLGFHLYSAPPKVPAAGIVERQLEQEYEEEPLQPKRSIPSIQLDIPDEKLELPDTRKVSIKKVDLLNNHILSEGEIFEVSQSYLNKEITLKQIYALCKKFEQLYAEHGYFLARVYPPPQEIHDGILKLEVIIGCLGEVSVIGNKFYTSKFIQSYFSHLKRSALKESAFLKALMLLNENTDLHASAIFEKGKQFGCADVVLQVRDSKPMHLYLNANNYGRDLTTNIRAGGRFDWGNILFQGDTISLAEVVGFPFNALYFTDARYKVPVSRIGTILELNYLFSKFKVEEMTNYKLSGRSNILTAKLDQAVLRTNQWNLDTYLSFDYKDVQNFMFDQETSFDRLRVLSLGVLLDHVHQGFARDLLNLSFGAGIPDLFGGLGVNSESSSRKGGGGRFFVFNADYDRIQFLPSECFLYAHGSVQLSPSKLTVPEQLYIGGYGTVRGFPFSVATGDSGYFVNLELRAPPPYIADKKFFWFKKKWKEAFQFDVFLDQAGAFLQSEQTTFLWGTGFGFRLNQLWGMDFSFDLGFPLNHANLAKGAFYYVKLTGQPF